MSTVYAIFAFLCFILVYRFDGGWPPVFELFGWLCGAGALIYFAERFCQWWISDEW